nr:hydrogen cyanide synthase subunit HcnC-like [Nerophis lumbriciformis]
MGHLVVMDDSADQLALTRDSCELWQELADRLPATAEDDPCGSLWIAADEVELAAAESKAEVYRAAGRAAEILSPSDLATAEPALRPGLAGALRIAGDRVVYPPAVARWLLDRAIDRGAELREGAEVAVIEDGAVRLANGERLEAPTLVNAAGAAAARLTPELPIEPRKGHLVITDRYPGLVRHQLVELGYLKSAHQITAESVAFNLQPRKTGQLLVGSSRELVGWDRRINRGIVARMLRRAAEFVPVLPQLVALRTWTGMRPATPDKLPLIGPWPATNGLWIAAGHEGLGITTALGTARLLADQLLGRTPRLDPEPFAPARVWTGATP